MDDPTNCPAWCVAEHARDGEGGVVRHRGATIALPVIAPDRGVELLVERFSIGDEPTSWVYIGDGTDQRLELSCESVARLASVLNSARG